jgi:hypothetical protein
MGTKFLASGTLDCLVRVDMGSEFTPPSSYWVPGNLHIGVMRTGREPGHWPLSLRLSIHGAVSPLPIRVHGVSDM